MPTTPLNRRCAFCREALAAHHTGETHPACEVPFAAEQAAGRAAEQAEALSELHAWLDGLWEEAELESSHDLDADRMLGVG